MSDVTDENVQDGRGVLRPLQQVASTSNFDDWTTRFIRNTLKAADKQLRRAALQPDFCCECSLAFEVWGQSCIITIIIISSSSSIVIITRPD